MSKIAICLLALSATLMPLRGQDPVEGEARGIQIRAFAFALFEGINTLELRLGDKPLAQLPLETGQLKNPVSVAAREFSFGVTKNEIFRSLGKITLPKAGKSFILVFTPIVTGYQAQIVRTDDPAFRGNDIYFFNYSKHRVGVMLGDAKNTIDPWKTSKLGPQVPAGAGKYQVTMAYEEEKEFKPFYNTNWPVNPNTRTLMFIFQDPKDGRMSIRSLTDIAP